MINQGYHDDMHFIARVVGKELPNTATTAQPFGPGFLPEDLEGIEAMEVWEVPDDESHEGYVEFRLMKDGWVIDRRRLRRDLF